jgi:response regulator of citrate/malate metabolism
MEDDLRKSREAGFVDHLIKPINLGRLQAALKRFETSLN